MRLHENRLVSENLSVGCIVRRCIETWARRAIHRYLSATNVTWASPTGVRRRLRHLPLLGDLLAGAAQGPRRLPPVPGGRDGFPNNPTGGVSASHSIYRARRARVFRRGRNIPRSAP